MIEKLRKLHNAKNEEELLAAIGSKVIILGEVDKNELKEKTNQQLEEIPHFHLSAIPIKKSRKKKSNLRERKN